MKVTKPVIFFFTICILFIALFALRSQWQQPLLDYIVARQVKFETAKLILDLINGAFAVIPGIVAFIGLFQPTQKIIVNPSPEPAICVTSPEKILGDYVGEGWKNTTWIDRGITTTGFFRDHPFVVFCGRMKSGKSREAAELVRSALQEGICLAPWTFDITPGVRVIQAEEVLSEIKKKAGPENRVLFFLNELPREHGAKPLEIIAEFLKFVKKCSPGYFVTTTRSEYLESNPELKKWLHDNGVTIIEMKSMDKTQASRMLDELIYKSGKFITGEIKQILVIKNDGTPYHLELSWKQLCDYGPEGMTEESAVQVASGSLEDIWKDIHRDLKTNSPAAESILEALCVFFRANVRPFPHLVLAYAARLERKHRPSILPGRIPKRIRESFGILEGFQVRQAELFVFPEMAVENLCLPDNARTEMKDFLLKEGTKVRLVSLLNHRKTADEYASALLDLSATHYYLNQKEEAIEIVKIILKTDSNHATSWNILGVLLNEQNHPIEAEEAYHKALVINPNYAAAWLNLGILLDEQNRPVYAEEALHRATAADPDDAAAWYNLGFFLDKHNRPMEAEKAYYRATAADPNYALAWSNLGGVLVDQDRPAEAEDVLRKGLVANPNHAAILFNLGISLIKQNRPVEAEKAWYRTTEGDPNNASAWYNLGNLQSDQNRLVEAEESYRKAIAAKPDDAAVWTNFGILLGKQENFAKAEEAFQKAIAVDSNDATAWFNLGILLSEQNRTVEAEKAYRKATEADPNDSAAWNNLGILFRKQNRLVDAEKAYRKAKEADPYNGAAWTNLGILNRIAKDHDQALEASQKAVELQPDAPIFHANLGAVLLAMGHETEAESEFAEAERLNKNPSLYFKACLSILRKDSQTAFSLLEQALANHETTVAWVSHDPDWEDAWDDPVFLSIISKSYE